LSFGRLSCTDPGPRRPPAAGQARTDPPQQLAQTPQPPCQIRVSVMDMSRLKKKLCRIAAAHRAGPSAGPPPDGAPRRGVSRQAGRRAGLLRPGRCSRDGAARSMAAHRAGPSAGPPHVLREVLQVGDDILTFDRHMIDISQGGKWHIPEWKVAYTRMESGIYQNGKWHMPKWKVAYSTIYQNGKWHLPKWKVAYTRMESGTCQNGKWHKSGIYQNGKWHMPKWKVAYTKVKSGIYQSGINVYAKYIYIFPV
jgi:hypothetical protein